MISLIHTVSLVLGVIFLIAAFAFFFIKDVKGVTEDVRTMEFPKKTLTEGNMIREHDEGAKVLSDKAFYHIPKKKINARFIEEPPDESPPKEPDFETAQLNNTEYETSKLDNVEHETSKLNSNEYETTKLSDAEYETMKLGRYETTKLNQHFIEPERGEETAMLSSEETVKLPKNFDTATDILRKKS